MTVAIVGLGSIGRRHVRVISHSFPAVEIVSVRRSESVSVPEDAMLQKRFGSLQEAIDHGVDAAILAGPASMRTEQAGTLLGADIPVLLEKPVAGTYRDANRLLNYDRGPGSAFARSLVGYVLRHHDAFSLLREHMYRSALGDLRSAHAEVRTFLPRWRPEQDYRKAVSAHTGLGGGVMRELSHEFDYLRALLGEFNATTAWRNDRPTIEIDAEEHVEMLLTTERDVPVSVSLDFATEAPETRRFRAVFSRGEVLWDLMGGFVEITGVGTGAERHDFQSARDEMFTAQFSHFLRCADGKTQPCCGIRDGIAIMNLIAAAERSFESRMWESLR